ncbi:hypothetical protein HK103_001285 [Boothiomyces macroporosus]|uniref:GATA-type domain-containing protein n=1 Tax=Boothiomyces macroporosus TaxID=261099 RepID=A0AAD5UAN3_9FUNG|nr:hypothetical protein HK103_001285 [Boothiomyces macroporosus]
MAEIESEDYKQKYFAGLEEQIKLHKIIKEQQEEINILKQKLSLQEGGTDVINVESNQNSEDTFADDKSTKSDTRACGDCSATVTSQWYNDHQKLGSYICKNCYRKRWRKRNSSLMASQCAVCKSTASAAWHQNKLNETVCDNCNHTPISATCNLCKSTNSPRWHVDQQDDSPKVEAPTAWRTCGNCGATQTSCWYKDRKRLGGHVCRKCYTNQNLTRVDVLPDGTTQRRQCSTCSSYETTSWYNDPDNPGTFNCIRCYQKRRLRALQGNEKKPKKITKMESTETLLPPIETSSQAEPTVHLKLPDWNLEEIGALIAQSASEEKK